MKQKYKRKGRTQTQIVGCAANFNIFCLFSARKTKCIHFNNPLILNRFHRTRFNCSNIFCLHQIDIDLFDENSI